MVVFGKNGCTRADSGCIRAIVVVFVEIGFIPERLVVFGQNGSIRTKVVIFGAKWLY